MFKLSRHKSSDKFGEKVEFKFFNLHASKVPRGWDRLMVSLVAEDSGKAIAKSGRALVRNGNCQWSDTLRESIFISEDEKEHEKYPYKLVVSTGSTSSYALGEAWLDLADYMNSKDSVPISLSLRNCSFGTVLQVKVQCLSPKTKFRDGKVSRQTMSLFEDPNADIDDLDIKSDESDNIHNRSTRSFSSPYAEEYGNRSMSASGSHRSSDSSESYMPKTNLSPNNSISGSTYNHIGRQDSTSFQNGITVGLGDDISKSNRSSFNSKISYSQGPEGNDHSSSLRYSDSSKEFLEAAQETIDELRGEARMWEKTARKFKGDFEALKKDFSEQSRHQAELDVELSTLSAERDSLMLEVKQMKLALEESVANQTTLEISKFQEEHGVNKQKELQDELKFQKESQASLALQLKKTQESNIELVQILQEFEETIERQKLEIAELSSKNQILHGSFDNDIHLHPEQENTSTSPVKIVEIDSSTRQSVNLEKETEALKRKIQDLERDCAELTEKNLNLVLMMEDSKKDIVEANSLLGSGSNTKYSMYSSKNELEQEPEKKEILSEGVSTKPLTICFHDIEKKCADLELDVQLFKDKTRDLDNKLQMSQVEVEEQKLELTELHQQLENHRTNGSDVASGRNVDEVGSSSYMRMSRLISDISKQLQQSMAIAKSSWFESDDCVTSETSISGSSDFVSLEEQTEAILQNCLELNRSLGEKIADCKVLFQKGKLTESQINLTDEESYGIKSLSSHKNIRKEAFASIYDTNDHRTRFSLKKDDITLTQPDESVVCMTAELHSKNCQLEEHFQAALSEASVASKSLDGVHQELLELKTSLESQVLANKILERKSLELESGKNELELSISELEQENIQLSERISGLEAQLRYMTNEKATNRLELESSRSSIVNLKNEICNLGAEIDAQRLELKQKLQECQKETSEAKDDSEFLKRSNSKLQSTAERLIDECNSLQKLNGDLRRQKLELHERCSLLEVELSKSQDKCNEFSEKFDRLQVKFASIQNDAHLKERSFISQLETIFQEHNENKEKLSEIQVLLGNMDVEKLDEVESLHKEIAHLNFQISSTHDEREEIASDAVREASSLRAEKNRLQSHLDEVVAKVKSYETELRNVQDESDSKFQGLSALLEASKQSEEMLMADMERVRKMMGDAKLREEKLKKAVNELELKLKASDYEREQMKEEISSLKCQLQKIPDLQGEISTLKSSLDEVKFEKAKLENSLQLISYECQEIKAERKLLQERFSSLQKELSDGEDAKLGKAALEEKLLRLECDLTAVEALYSQDAELRNEINRTKRTNSQYQRKIESLEEEREEFMKRIKNLEKELKSKNENGKEQFLSFSLQENKVLETNNTYPVQLQDVKQESHGTKSSSLEAELKDMQERYLQMSLRYAEVEAQREELVMKLKSSKKERRWFS